MSRMAIYSISVYLVSVTINLPIQNAFSLLHSIILERGGKLKQSCVLTARLSYWIYIEVARALY